MRVRDILASQAAPSRARAGATVLLALLVALTWSNAALAATGTTVASTRSGGSTGISTAAIVAAAAAAFVALCCLLWAIARMNAFEPRWTLSLRHALAEAGFRASATWAEFTDWARLGR
jgi:hypothetical protein